MIGDYYHRDNWNCTHEVAQWYASHGYGDVIQPVSQCEWNTSFVIWMRRRFDMIDEPCQGALVIMRNAFGLHVGVWDDGMIHHCDSISCQTIRSPLSIIKLFFKEVSYARLKNG